MESNRDYILNNRPKGYRPPHFEKELQETSERRQRELEKEFNKIDEDKSGTLSKDEIK